MLKNESPKASACICFAILAILTGLLLAVVVSGTFRPIFSQAVSAAGLTASLKQHSSRLSVKKPDAAAQLRIVDAYGKLPLYFEANQGQTDQRVRFLSRGSGRTLFLTSTEAVLVLANQPPGGKRKSAARDKLTGTILSTRFLGANPEPRVVGREELPGKVNYFIGNDPANWRTAVTTYAKVRYEHVYPGIDLVYYGNQRQLEYDFVVAPGADPTRIRLGLEGAQNIGVDAQGSLIVQTADGWVRWDKPVVYQEVGGQRQSLEGNFVVGHGREVSFSLAAYDATKPLVIDPSLAYSTYLGGSGGDFGSGITVDSAGNAYVTGATTSSDFPATSGAFQVVNRGPYDVFIAKIDPPGSALVYTTYLGGSGSNACSGPMNESIAVDSLGSAYVTGETGSGDFPITPGAFQTGNAGSCDAFIAKLGPVRK